MRPDGGAVPPNRRRLQRVVFPAMAVTDMVTLLTHIEDVARELQLILIDGSANVEIPVHISALSEALMRGRGTVRNEIRRQLMVAMEAGAVEFRLELDVPDHAELIARGVTDLLDQTDECSDRGLLLTPIAPPGARRAIKLLGGHVRDDRTAPTAK